MAIGISSTSVNWHIISGTTASKRRCEARLLRVKGGDTRYELEPPVPPGAQRLHRPLACACVHPRSVDVGSTTAASSLTCCSGAAPDFNFSASLNHPSSSTIRHTGPTPMPVPDALPTLRVSNGEEACVFVGMVSYGAKSSGTCSGRSTSSITVDVDVEVDAAAVAVGPEKSGTGRSRWRWWIFGFGSRHRWMW
jgi:hypothetical protein